MSKLMLLGKGVTKSGLKLSGTMNTFSLSGGAMHTMLNF